MSSSEAPAVRPGSRAIARAAVQSELSLAAYELVVEKGYGSVTLDDMAADGGVDLVDLLREGFAGLGGEKPGARGGGRAPGLRSQRAFRGCMAVMSQCDRVDVWRYGLSGAR